MSAAFKFDNRFLGPILITGILISAHLSFGILEGYSRTGVAIAVAIAPELVLGRLDVRPLAPPGQRLHHGHQRRHPGAVAVSVALCAGQPDLDHLEVRAA